MDSFEGCVNKISENSEKIDLSYAHTCGPFRAKILRDLGIKLGLRDILGNKDLGVDKYSILVPRRRKKIL